MYTRFCCQISSSSQCAFALLLLLILSTPQALQALPEDADQPIHIRADTVEYDQNGNRVIYRGSVQVDQGTMRVTAETMTIDLQDGKKVIRITAVDTPAHYTQQIEHDEKPVQAEALTIIYHTQDERVDLMGEANLEQEGSTLSGDLIVYDIVAGKVDATAASDVPVTMILQPSVTNSNRSESSTPEDLSNNPDNDPDDGPNSESLKTIETGDQ